ncbi:MAG: hypothetical protein ACHQT7_00820 [Candidatus Levyibacteriota bacterium]
MPATTRPTVTDEHLKKYATIMGTAVKSNAPPAPTPVKADAGPSNIAALIASLPKPKGIGDKMFIFTGKKKIIMDGTQREVENIKTVDATPPPPKVEKKVEVKPEKMLTEKELVAKDVPTEVIEHKYEKEKESNIKKVPIAKPHTEAAGQKSKLPTILIYTGTILFISAWTVFWLNFFGYIKLF